MSEKYSRSSLDAYFEEISKYPLLTPDEEICLSRLVQRGMELEALGRDLTPQEQREVRRGAAAKRRFTHSNLRLVVFVAKKYASRNLESLDMLDLIQEGSFGLVRAIERFDPERGYKFSTYAFWWVRQSINRSIFRHDNIIRRPIGVCELLRGMSKTRLRLEQALGRPPSKQELAEALDVPVTELELVAERAGTLLSLDMHMNSEEHGSCVLDYVADPMSTWMDEDDITQEWQREHIEMALDQLNEMERVMLSKRYGLDEEREFLTLKEIASRYGKSRERTRQIIQKALQKMKYHLARVRILAPVQRYA
jgi:RNA polymerase primary sigma factor